MMGTGVKVGVWLGVGVMVGVDVFDEVGEGVMVEVFVAVGDGDGVDVDVMVAVSVGVGENSRVVVTVTVSVGDRTGGDVGESPGEGPSPMITVGVLPLGMTGVSVGSSFPAPPEPTNNAVTPARVTIVSPAPTAMALCVDSTLINGRRTPHRKSPFPISAEIPAQMDLLMAGAAGTKARPAKISAGAMYRRLLS